MIAAGQSDVRSPAVSASVRAAADIAAMGDDIPIDAHALRALCIKGYIANLPGVILGNLSAAVLMAWVYWPHVDRGVLVGWFLAIAALMAVQTQRLLAHRRDPDALPARLLPVLLICGAFATGSLWGAMPWLFDVQDSFALQVFALFTVAVLNTGGAATLAPYYPAYMASLAPCLPVAAINAFSLQGDFGPAAGIGMLILAVFLAGLSRIMARAFESAYRIQLTQRVLLERLRLQVEVAEEAAVAAERAGISKIQFLASISHEIRTPVNAVLGGIEIMRATSLDAAQTRCLDMMVKAGESLLSQVDDLLAMTRVESGRMKLEEVAFDLHQRLYDTVEMVAPQAAAGGLSLDLQIERAVPRHVHGDPGRLDQILLNLLGNALKFTPAGGVILRAALASAAVDGKVRVRLSVVDTGIGIPAGKLGAIFDPFTQADGSTARRFGGTGLGLAIVRGIVGLMNGRIWVESTEGLGSTFHVELPLGVVESRARAKAPRPEALPVWVRPRDLLLVEDEPANRFVATELLTRRGFRIASAASGPEALDLVVGRRFDAILMDLGMPGMDGFETMAALRASPDPATAMTPVIALTANVLPETVTRCAEAGMVGFVSKPIRLPELLRALAEAIPPDDSQSSSVPETPGTAVRLADLRSMVGDAAVEEMLTKAMRGVDDARAALADARVLASPRKVADIAHRLCGALDAVGFSAAAEAARELERRARGRDAAMESLDGPIALLLERLEALRVQTL